MKNKKPTVSVVMITYKHENYIKQAIEGVLMQQCDFEVELIIADDCSPDATETVVKQLKNNNLNGNWINYTKHTENKGMMPNFIWALEQAKGKYIALCEGDDYWTDPLKLQKQVNFLEEHEEYGLICTNYNIINELGLIQENILKLDGDLDIDIENLILKRYVATLTVVFRTIYIEKILFELKVVQHNNWKIGDLPIWLTILNSTKIKCLNFNSSNYRIVEVSASGRDSFINQMEFNDSVIEMSKYYLNKFNYDKKYISKMLEFRLKFIFNIILKFNKLDYFNIFFKKLKNEDVSCQFYLKMKIKSFKFLTRKFIKSILNE